MISHAFTVRFRRQPWLLILIMFLSGCAVDTALTTDATNHEIDLPKFDLDDRVSGEFHATPAIQLARDIELVWGLPLAIDTGMLGAKVFDRPVRLHVQHLTKRQVLDLYVRRISTDRVTAVWSVEGDFIVVTTEDRLDRIQPRVRREYDAAALARYGREVDGYPAGDRLSQVLDLIRETLPPDVHVPGGMVRLNADDRRIVAVTNEPRHRAIRRLLDELETVVRGDAPAVLIDPLDTPAARQTWKRLREPIAVDWRALPLDDWLDRLSADVGVPFAARWERLAELGIDPGAKLTLQMTDAPAAAALDVVLGQAAAPLGYTVDGAGVVIVSSQEDLDRPRPVMGIYAVGDLMRDRMRREAGATLDERYRAASDRLADTVRRRVAPGTWRMNGGRLGSVVFVADLLVVVTTREHHDVVTAVLNGLRRGDASPR